MNRTSMPPRIFDDQLFGLLALAFGVGSFRRRTLGRRRSLLLQGFDINLDSAFAENLNRQLDRHVAMQPDGYGITAKALDGFAQNDLAAIDFVPLLLQLVGHVHRSD